MAAVVTFWRLPGEEGAFLEFLKSTGDVVGVPWEKVPNRSLLVPRTMAELVSEDPDSILIGLRETLGDIPINEFFDESGHSYAAAASTLPMMIYSRGKWRDSNKLGASNLSGQWAVVPSGAKEWVDQPAVFIKWGRKVMSWVRKQTPLWHKYERYRITRKVDEAIKRGAEIVP
jgi:hypothetical protein